MTDPTVTDSDTVDTAAVEALLQSLLKGMRATQLYMPNNPVYQTAIGNVRKAFTLIWDEVEELVLVVQENEMVWQGEPVLRQPRNESLAWMLYKDGLRSLTIERGAEDDEIPRFLNVLQKARNLPPEADDDLLTLLWEQSFESIKYDFVELAPEDAAPLTKSDDEPQPAAAPPRQVVEEEQQESETPQGMVNLDDFDSTLYFLDDNDVAYLKTEFEREYNQDLRGNVLAVMFDLFELQTYPTVRAEIISIVENLIPYLLGAGDFRSVAYILRESRVVLDRAREVLPEQAEALQELPSRLSEPDAITQLLQSLDEAVIHPTEEELGALFGELRGGVLETVLEWLPRMTNERVRDILGLAVQRIAAQYPDALAKAMGSDDDHVVLETVRLAAKLKLPPVITALGSLLIRDGTSELKVAVVDALSAIGSPGAMQQLEKGVSDEHRDVRVAAVRVLGTRGHRAVFPKVEAAVLGKSLKDTDLTEKMVFFEAYGRLAGPEAITHLKPMLATGGFMKKKPDVETRACAAMALGKIGTPEARDLLERATRDKDPLVRNAVNKALREAK